MGRHLDDLDRRARAALANGRRIANNRPLHEAIANLADRLSREGVDACEPELKALAALIAERHSPRLGGQ